jgi:hypothetical protein
MEEENKIFKLNLRHWILNTFQAIFYCSTVHFNSLNLICQRMHFYTQCVPLATESGISLRILTQMKILQRNLNRSAFVFWEMKRNVSIVGFKFRCNILISGKIIKEMPDSVASGTPYIITIPENICAQTPGI